MHCSNAHMGECPSLCRYVGGCWVGDRPAATLGHADAARGAVCRSLESGCGEMLMHKISCAYRLGGGCGTVLVDADQAIGVSYCANPTHPLAGEMDAEPYRLRLLVIQMLAVSF